jgi:hypothetical protein
MTFEAYYGGDGGGHSRAHVHAYLQDSTPPRHQRELGGSGGTLYVRGMAEVTVVRNGCTSSFRSPGCHGEAHLKDLRHLSHDKMSPQPNYMTPRKSPSDSRAGSAAFASKMDDRYSYLPSQSSIALTSHLFGLYSTNGSPQTPSSPTEGGSQRRQGGRDNSPSASFRSTTPTASAHFPKNKPVEPHFIRDEMSDGSPLSSVQRLARHQRPTSSFRSSAERDSYVKAQPQRLDSCSPLTSDFDKCKAKGRGGTSSFKYSGSIGDAHIRALTKPVDVCLAYGDSAQRPVSSRGHQPRY